MKWIICIAVLLTSNHLVGQLSLNHQPFETSEISFDTKAFSYSKLQLPFYKPPISSSQLQIVYPDVIPGQKAFFCRIEDAIVKSSKVNFKFPSIDLLYNWILSTCPFKS